MFGGDGVATFAYDVLDNLKRFKVGATDNLYSYNAINQLQTVNRQSDGVAVVGLSYDVRGNLLNKNGRGFSFDYGNRLREVPGVEYYRYDAHGRRVLNWSPTLGNIVSFYGQDGVLRYQDDQRLGKNTDYLYLGGSLIAKVTDNLIPDAPTLSGPSYSSTGTFTVSWSSQPTATGYELQEQFNGGSWSSVYTGASTSFQATGRAAGSYGYRAKACLNTACSGWGTVKTIAVTLPPTSAPTVTAPGQAANGNYSISWTAVGQATTYNLEESFNGGGWTSAYNGANLSQGFSSKPGGSYAYRVTACNPGGCGPVSSTKTVQSVYAPGATSLSAPGFNNTGSFTVSWGGVGSATSYVLDEQVNGGSWTMVQDSGATSWGASGRGTATYGYRARACNIAGCSGYSATVSTPVVLPPGSAPGISVPGTSTSGTYTVSWNGVSAATRYPLEEQVNGGTWTLVQDNGAGSWSPTGKTPATYGYRIRACNDGGCSGYSGTASIVVSNPVPASPTNVRFNYTVMEVNKTRYVARWDAVTDATSYELNGFIAYTGPNLTYALVKNAAPSTSAQVSVRACNAYGCSAWVYANVVAQ